jgi:hypothetical protein
VSQQINLFNPIFLKQKKYFSATTMVEALAMIVLGMAALVAFAYYQSYKLNQQAAATARQLAAVQAQIAKLNTELVPRKANKAIEDAIQKTEDDIKVAQHALETLQGGDLGNTKGYSPYLRAFSRQIIDGLWLTGFRIEGAGTAIGLEGRTLRPELVPVYIKRLKQEPTMQGKTFASLDMQTPVITPVSSGTSGASGTVSKPVPAAYIEFNLQSAGMTPEPANTTSGAKPK